MNNLPKINQLRNFQAIIRYGSIRAASKALFQTQPAMTKSIQELERILGCTLLARGDQGIILTKLGRIFEPRVNMLLNDLERAIDELKQMSLISQGSIAFGCSHLPAYSIMPSVVNKFRDIHPEANINVIEGQFDELVTSLRLGRLDFYLGIASPEISMREFSVEYLVELECCIIARNGHPLINSNSLTQLQRSKWYIPNSRAGYYKSLEGVIFPAGQIGGKTVIFGDSMSIAEQLVLNEDYLFVGPKAVLDVTYLKDVISMIHIKEKLPKALYMLVYKQQQGVTPLAKELMDDIKIALSKMFISNS